jgi:glycosyltransferase involved in cell wall biosynthesis
MRGRYPHEPESKFLHIPNGFDATRLRSTNLSPGQGTSDKILATYVGSLYTSTEPSTLVQALESLPPEIKSRFKLRFIGHIEAASYRRALLRLGEMVELKGYMPQHEALAAMEETDYVLLISHDRLNVSAKFYDYIGAGKPILACVHPDGDIRTMLEDLQAGWWADSRDIEGIQQLFLDAAARGDSLLTDFQPDKKKIVQYERKVLAQRYARLLHSIARGQDECGLDVLAADHPEKVSTQC